MTPKGYYGLQDTLVTRCTAAHSPLQTPYEAGAYDGSDHGLLALYQTEEEVMACLAELGRFFDCFAVGDHSNVSSSDEASRLV